MKRTILLFFAITCLHQLSTAQKGESHYMSRYLCTNIQLIEKWMDGPYVGSGTILADTLFVAKDFERGYRGVEIIANQTNEVSYQMVRLSIGGYSHCERLFKENIFGKLSAKLPSSKARKVLEKNEFIKDLKESGHLGKTQFDFEYPVPGTGSMQYTLVYDGMKPFKLRSAVIKFKCNE